MADRNLSNDFIKAIEKNSFSAYTVITGKERNFHHGKDRYYNNIWRIP